MKPAVKHCTKIAELFAGKKDKTKLVGVMFTLQKGSEMIIVSQMSQYFISFIKKYSMLIVLANKTNHHYQESYLKLYRMIQINFISIKSAKISSKH